MAGACTIQLLGFFAVEVDGRRIPAEAWHHRRGADLIKLLALAPSHRLQREQIIDALWPELSQAAGTANLRKAVYFARRALGREEAIAVEAGTVALWPKVELRIDANLFEESARQALATGSGLLSAVDLFTGDLLPEDRYTDWTEPHRERIRRRCLELLRLAGRWERIVEIDPTNEEAHRALMRDYLQDGNRHAAIQQFRRLREVLRVDLGVGPDEETVALFERALAMGRTEPAGTAERATALIARGLLQWNRQNLDDAERAAQTVYALALGEGLGRELGEASALLGLVAWARGRWRDLFHDEFLKVLREAPDQAPFVCDAHLCFAEACLYGIDAQTIARSAKELLAVAEASRSVHGRALMTLLIGEAELLSGRLTAAEEQLLRAAGLYERIGGSAGRTLALVRLAEIAATNNRRADASALLSTARRLAERSEFVSHLMVRVFAAVLHADARRAQQMRTIEEAERLLSPREVCGPCSIGFRIGATIACARAGDIARARRSLVEAERLAGMWQGGPWLAATWEARAALRRVEGDNEQSAALLREAADLFAQSGRPVDQARCRAAAEATHRMFNGGQ